MTWKVFKLIFRIDFDPEFLFLSKFGEIAHAIKRDLLLKHKEEFANVKLKVNPREVSLSNIFKSEVFQVKVSVNSLILDVEEKEGLFAKSLSKTRGFISLGEVVKILNNVGIAPKKFQRTGFRSWSICPYEKSFDSIKDAFFEASGLFSGKKRLLSGERRQDFCYIAECKIEEGLIGRVVSGPFAGTEKEGGRYFTLSQPNAGAGIILDFDLYRMKDEHVVFKPHEILSRWGSILTDMQNEVWRPHFE